MTNSATKIYSAKEKNFVLDVWFKKSNGKVFFCLKFCSNENSKSCLKVPRLDQFAFQVCVISGIRWVRSIVGRVLTMKTEVLVGNTQAYKWIQSMGKWRDFERYGLWYIQLPLILKELRKYIYYERCSIPHFVSLSSDLKIQITVVRKVRPYNLLNAYKWLKKMMPLSFTMKITTVSSEIC